MSGHNARNVRPRTETPADWREAPAEAPAEAPLSLPLRLYNESCAFFNEKRLTRMRVLGDTVARFAPEHGLLARLEQHHDKVYPIAEHIGAKLRVLLKKQDSLDAAKEVYDNTQIAPLVLNMANALRPGGGYRSGSAAQEENLFRRSNLHYCFKDGEVVADARDPTRALYSKAMQDLINATNGVVYISDKPRYCIRDSEHFERHTLGYDLYPNEADCFPFYEMRSAALAVDGESSEEQRVDASNRIRAQFLSARRAGHRVLVLSAFGCGAFGGHPNIVAEEYCKAILDNKHHFSLIVFAIHFAGWGKHNLEVFDEVFERELSAPLNAEDGLYTGRSGYYGKRMQRQR